METEVQVKRSRRNKLKIAVIILLILIVLMLSSASVFAYMTLENDKAYKGVSIDGLDVSGLDRQAVQELLDAHFTKPAEGMEIILKTADSELKASYPELEVKYDTRGAVEEAFSVGRTGNIFRRLYDIARAGIDGVRLSVPQSYNEEKIDNFVARFSVNIFQSVKENALLITDDKVIIRSGRHGKKIDRVETADLVKDMISNRKSGIIEPEVIVTNPAQFNIDDLYNQIVSEPADAGFKIENSEVAIVPHSMGRQIDKAELAAIVNEVEKTEETERTLPVAFIKPAVTSDMASAMLFRDELASYSTTFSTATQNGKNRKFNMGLAADKINGLILLPGEEFSFNRVVGPRDVEHGYKTAHVYISGRVEDGIGGGICQVSTTMYNAVLKADLQVLERKSHSFTVGYVPLGQDATAYYGGTDFRFLNSTNWPIKLEAVVSGNKISFKLIGTNETPKKSVIISNKILSKTPHETKYFDDPNLEYGKTKEKQEGLDGFVVETYKTIKVDGKVISQSKLHTSRYVPCTEEIWVGKKGAPVTTPGAITTQPGIAPAVPGEAAPTDSEPPVDEIVDEGVPESN